LLATCESGSASDYSFCTAWEEYIEKNAHMGLVHPAMPKTSLKRRRRRAGLMACVMTSLYQMSLLHGCASAEHQIFSISVWWANFAAEN